MKDKITRFLSFHSSLFAKLRVFTCNFSFSVSSCFTKPLLTDKIQYKFFFNYLFSVFNIKMTNSIRNALTMYFALEFCCQRFICLLSLCHTLVKTVTSEWTNEYSQRAFWKSEIHSLDYSSWAENVEFYRIPVNKLLQNPIVIGSCEWKQTKSAREYNGHLRSTSRLQL